MLLFKQAGMFAIPLLILSLVILGLIIRCVLAIMGHKVVPDPFAILFWGCVAAVLGFLGQCSGLYIALTTISRAREISPAVVSRGFAESFSTTIWGCGLLLISAIAWFVLHGRPSRSETSRAMPTASGRDRER